MWTLWFSVHSTKQQFNENGRPEAIITIYNNGVFNILERGSMHPFLLKFKSSSSLT